MAIIVKDLPFEEAYPLIEAVADQHWEEIKPFEAAVKVDKTLCKQMHSGFYLKTLCAFEDDQFIGYLVVTSGPMIHEAGQYEMVTHAFYVLPHKRGLGVFNALLKYAEDLCKEHKIKLLTVTVHKNFVDSDSFELALSKHGFTNTYALYSREVNHGHSY